MTMTTENCSALVRNKPSRVRRKRIKETSNSIRQRKLVPKVPKVTDQFVD